MAATITAAVAAAGGVEPAGAGRPADPGLQALCNELAQDPPQGGAELITDPPQGARLRAGQKVTVTLRWDRRDFAGADLERSGHCIVTLDGRPRLELSALEAPSANDGEYRGSFVMPADLAPGDCLCVLGVASGEAPEGGPLRLGGSSCLTVTEPGPPGPTPPTTTPPATTPPATTATTAPPARPATVVLPAATETRPEPAVSSAAQPVPEPLAELPRTGPFDVRLVLALGGLALVLGGGAVTTRR